MAKHRTGYLFKRGSSFYVQWRVNGKIFSRALRDENGESITNRREAEDAKTKLMASFVVADEAAALESISAKLSGKRAELERLELEQNPPMRIADGWREFVSAANRPDSGESTLRQYQFQFSAFARWMAAEHQSVQSLSAVTRQIAEEYAAQLLKDGASANTFNKHLNLLALVFRVLKDKARLPVNPWTEIQRKRLTTQSRRELTIDELRRVCASATGELRILFALGIYTGLRLGDCATLRWSEVDMAREMIRRVPNKTARRNPKPVCVHIHSVLRDLLAEIPADKRGGYVLPETAKLYLDRIDSVTDIIKKHLKSCGIDPHKPGTGNGGKRAVVEVGFHSLRHTFVSLCRESNAPLAVVESIVGHSSPAMTRHYTHVGELAGRNAVSALPAVLGEQKCLPATRGSTVELIEKIGAILEDMSGENWQVRRSEALALLKESSVTPSQLAAAA